MLKVGPKQKDPMDEVFKVLQVGPGSGPVTADDIARLANPDAKPDKPAEQPKSSNDQTTDDELDEKVEEKEEEEEEARLEKLLDKKSIDRAKKVFSERVMRAHLDSIKETAPDKMTASEGYYEVSSRQVDEAARLFTSSDIIGRIWTILCNSILQGGVLFTDTGKTKTRAHEVHENTVWTKFIQDVIRAFMCWGFVGVTWRPSGDDTIGIPIVVDMTDIAVCIKRSIYGGVSYVAYPRSINSLESDGFDPNVPLKNIRFFEGRGPPDKFGNLRSPLITASRQLVLYDTLTEIALRGYARMANPPMIVRREQRRSGIEDLSMGIPDRSTGYVSGAVRGKVVEDNMVALNKASADLKNSQNLGIRAPIRDAFLAGTSAGFTSGISNGLRDMGNNPYAQTGLGGSYAPVTTARIDLAPGEHASTLAGASSPSELLSLRMNITGSIAMIWGIPPSYMGSGGERKDNSSLSINQRQVFDASLLRLRSRVSSVVNPVYKWIHYIPDALHQVMQADGGFDVQVTGPGTVELSAPPPAAQIVEYMKQGFIKWEEGIKLLAAQTNTSLRHWNLIDPVGIKLRMGIKEESKDDDIEPAPKTQADSHKLKSKRKIRTRRPSKGRKKMASDWYPSDPIQTEKKPSGSESVTF